MENDDRDANKNKIFGFISITKSKPKIKSPNSVNLAAKEKHRKQKDASRKERKATQTLAIVLGKRTFLMEIENTHKPRKLRYFGGKTLTATYKTQLAR